MQLPMSNKEGKGGLKNLPTELKCLRTQEAELPPYKPNQYNEPFLPHSLSWISAGQCPQIAYPLG